MRSRIFVAIAVGSLLAVWIVIFRRGGDDASIDTLRSAIDASSLPASAKAELHAELDRGVIRPSQVEFEARVG